MGSMVSLNGAGRTRQTSAGLSGSSGTTSWNVSFEAYESMSSMNTGSETVFVELLSGKCTRYAPPARSLWP
eukprot:8059844-Pyramimonas_sp.AAC.1